MAHRVLASERNGRLPKPRQQSVPSVHPARRSPTGCDALIYRLNRSIGVLSRESHGAVLRRGVVYGRRNRSMYVAAQNADAAAKNGRKAGYND